MRSACLIGLGLLLSQGLARADFGVNATLTGMSHGAANAVALKSDTCLLGAGSTLVLIDISSSWQPEEISTFATAGLINGIAVQGETVYLSTGIDGLQIVDIDTPESPVLVSRIDRPAVDAVAIGDVLYLVDSAGLLACYDLQTPASPQLLDEIDLDMVPTRLEYQDLQGALQVFVSGSTGLQLVDVADPESLALQGFLPTVYLNGLAVNGTEAYLASSGEGLLLADISSPMSPVLEEGSYNPGGSLGCSDVHVQGWSILVSCYINGLKLLGREGDAFYESDSWGGGIPVQGVGDDDRWVAADYQFGMRVYEDFGKGSVDEYYRKASSSRGLFLQGEDLFSGGHRGGVRLLDLSEDAGNPNEIGRAEYFGPVFGLVAEDRQVYASLFYSGFVSLDFSLPGDPEELSLVDTEGQAQQFDLDGDRLLVGDGFGGLQLYDVSNPASPMLLDSLHFASDVYDVSSEGDLAICAATSDGVIVLDRSDPDALSVLGQWDETFFTRGVHLSDGRAYVAAAEGLFVIDLEDPTQPGLLAAHALPSARDVIRQGNIAYVASQSDGFYAVDISNLNNTQTVASYQMPEGAEDLEVAGDRVYMAGYRAGVFALQVEIPQEITPALPATLDCLEDASVAFVPGEHINNPGGVQVTIAVQGSEHIAAEMSGDSLIATPQPDFFGTESLTVLVTNESTEQTIPVDLPVVVQNLPDDPVLQLPEALSLDEDTVLPLDLQLYASDADGDDLLFEPEAASLELQLFGNQLFLVPPPDWNGSDWLFLLASDDSQDRATVQDSVLVTVQPVDDPPRVIQPLDELLIPEDGSDSSIDLATVFTEVDGQELGFSVDPEDLQQLSVEILGGQVSITPAADWNGEQLLSFIAFDDEGPQRLQTVEELLVRVTPVNDAPHVIQPPQELLLPEDGSDSSIDLDTVFDDVDGDPLSYSANSEDLLHLQVEFAGSQLTITPQADWHGSETVILRAEDGQDPERLGVSVDLPVTVTPVNDPPYVIQALGEVQIPEDGSDSSIDLVTVFGDVDGDALAYSAEWDANQLDVQISGSQVTITPVADWNGSATILFTADDDDSEARDTASEDLLVIVVPENDAPLIDLPPGISMAEDAGLVEDFGPYLEDVDGDPLLLAVSGNTEIAVLIDGEEVSFSSPADWHGEEVLVFSVEDDFGRLAASDTTTVVVTPVNDAPVVIQELDELQIPEDGSDSSIDLATVFGDVDGDPLSYSANTEELEHLDVSVVDGVVTITPISDWAGSETVVFTADDAQEEDRLAAAGEWKHSASKGPLRATRDTATEDLLVVVLPEQDCPELCVPLDSLTSGLEDTPFVISNVDSLVAAHFCDADAGDSLVVATLLADVEGLEIDYVDNVATLTPPQDFFGSITLTLSVSDGDCAAEAVIAWEILPVNDVPVVSICNTEDLPCGEIPWPDLESFLQVITEEGLELQISDAEDTPMTLRWMLDGEEVASQDAISGPCSFYLPDLEGLLDHDLSLHAELVDGEHVWNLEGGVCQWLLQNVDLDQPELPRDFYLGPVAPNPFNPATRLAFGLPREAELELRLYNLQGALVSRLSSGRLPAGHHEARIDGTGLASGVYIAVLESPGLRLTEKMLLLK